MDVSNFLLNVGGSLIASILLAIGAAFFAAKKHQRYRQYKRKRAIEIILALVLSGAISYFALGGVSNVTFDLELELSLLFAIVLFVTILFIYEFFSNYIGRFDIFLSAPMSFLDQAEREKVADQCIQIVNLLKTECGFTNIYFAGATLRQGGEFNPSGIAAADDISALARSKRFVFYTPRKVHSSTIFEAGYALRKGLPSIYLYYDENDIPFLMRGMGDCHRSVNLYKAQSFESLKLWIKSNGRKLFDNMI